MTCVETVLGLAGGTCSGKTRLARGLCNGHDDGHVAVLSFDAYYHDLSHLAPAVRGRLNYDHPDSLDVDTFVADLQTLVGGDAVGTPVYDFVSHTRDGEVHVVEPRSVVVVEGILVLAFPAIRALLDHAVFIDVAAEVRLSRRLVRDRRDRGRDPDDVRRQFAESVQPMYEQFVLPSAEHADLVLDSAGPDSIDAVRRLCGLPEARSRGGGER